MTKDEHIQHLVNSSEQDCHSMQGLFASGHYTWSLFVGHLSLEKLLKAYYIKEVDLDFPYIHNLLRLAELASLQVSGE
jgi:HEPN domain-containing protein